MCLFADFTFGVSLAMPWRQCTILITHRFWIVSMYDARVFIFHFNNFAFVLFFGQFVQNFLLFFLLFLLWMRGGTSNQTKQIRERLCLIGSSQLPSVFVGLPFSAVQVFCIQSLLPFSGSARFHQHPAGQVSSLTLPALFWRFVLFWRGPFAPYAYVIDLFGPFLFGISKKLRYTTRKATKSERFTMSLLEMCAELSKIATVHKQNTCEKEHKSIWHLIKWTTMKLAPNFIWHTCVRVLGIGPHHHCDGIFFLIWLDISLLLLRCCSLKMRLIFNFEFIMEKWPAHDSMTSIRHMKWF